MEARAGAACSQIDAKPVFAKYLFKFNLLNKINCCNKSVKQWACGVLTSLDKC
jgi:hypothetical protein